jgi:hypothetical protein
VNSGVKRRTMNEWFYRLVFCYLINYLYLCPMNDKITDTIINYLREEYKDSLLIQSKERPNSLFYIHNGRVIFDYNKEYNCSFVSGEIISFINSFFELSDNHRHQVLRIWIDVMIGISPASIIEDDFVAKLRWSEI